MNVEDCEMQDAFCTGVITGVLMTLAIGIAVWMVVT